MNANGEIRARTVKVINLEGEFIGDLAIEKAIALAKAEGLDLVEVSPNATPPVCKIMDYGRYKFKNQKKQSKNKKSKDRVKEIKLRPVTDVGDYQIKLKRAVDFLQSGHKVKVTLRFRGREIAHQDIGFTMVQRFLQDLEGHAVVDQSPKIEGRQIHLMLSPK